MIKHIVLFKLKELGSAEEKMKVMTSFKHAIEALKDRIEGVLALEVGLNCNPAELYDIALVAEFATMEDLAFYATHPEHVAAAAILKDVKDGRACVDFQITV